jgi:DNA-binding transcriptional LysR family regulator
VRPTPAGEAFLEEARRTLAHAQLTVDIAQRAASGKLGTLRLSFVPSAGLTVVPRLLRDFRQGYPDVKLILTPETTAQQLIALTRGQVDAGLVVPPLHESRGLRVRPLSEESLVLAVPSTHPLAGRARVQLKDLAKEIFVGFMLKDGPGFESVVMAACQESGFLPRFAQAASQMQSILALVAAGHGVALVPDAMTTVHVAGTAYVQVRQGKAAVRYTLGIAWNPQNENAALQAFIAVAGRGRAG